MPRTGRLHISNGVYHLIGRGLERRAIFAEDKDKREFLRRLEVNLRRSGVKCYAWALMPNHYHLLVRIGSKPLQSLMQPLLTGFAGYYNACHQRAGYVFQNRYQSILCEEEQYLLQLVRYIHRNPVKAGLVPDMESLATYPWTGHAGMLGRNTMSWHDVSDVLRRFHAQPSQARKRYCEFIVAGANEMEGPNLSGGGVVRSTGGWEDLSKLRCEHVQCIGDERILGNDDFVKQTLIQDKLLVEKRSKYLRQGWGLEELITTVCNYYGIAPSQINRRSRGDNVSRAKSLICYFGFNELGKSMRDIAQKLEISQPAVSVWVKKGEHICHVDSLGIQKLLS